MRKIDDGLHRALKYHIPQLIEHQGDNDGERKQDHDFKEADDDRIFKYLSKVRRREQLLEVLPSHPRAVGKSGEDVEILKCNRYAIHRRVLEQQNEQDARYERK